MKKEVWQFGSQLQYFKIVALVLVSVCSMRALAQDDHSHTWLSQITKPQQNSKASF